MSMTCTFPMRYAGIACDRRIDCRAGSLGPTITFLTSGNREGDPENETGAEEEANAVSVVDEADDEESARPQSCRSPCATSTVVPAKRPCSAIGRQFTTPRISIMQDNTLRYRASRLDCQGCPLKPPARVSLLSAGFGVPELFRA